MCPGVLVRWRQVLTKNPAKVRGFSSTGDGGWLVLGGRESQGGRYESLRMSVQIRPEPQLPTRSFNPHHVHQQCRNEHCWCI